MNMFFLLLFCFFKTCIAEVLDWKSNQKIWSGHSKWQLFLKNMNRMYDRVITIVTSRSLNTIYNAHIKTEKHLCKHVLDQLILPFVFRFTDSTIFVVILAYMVFALRSSLTHLKDLLADHRVIRYHKSFKTINHLSLSRPPPPSVGP